MEAAIVNPNNDFGGFDGYKKDGIETNQPGITLEPTKNQPGNANGIVDSANGSEDKQTYEGFEAFFHTNSTSTEQLNQTGTTLVTGLTLKAAVEFYKISEKTIRLHISQGKIAARKEQGPRGLEWRIYPNGIPAEFEIIEEVTEVRLEENHPGTAQTEHQNHDGTKLEPALDKTDNRKPSELDKLLELVQTQSQKLEVANYRIGYLESQTQTYKEQIKLLTDSQHKLGWWSQFCSWFIGKR